MKRRLVIAALLGLAFAPGRADGQTPEERIAAARRSVAAAGIPTSLIDTRVAEGNAKGVSMDRIAAVVERRAASLAGAQAAMASAPNLGASDLSAGADALEAGIDDGSLRAVIQGARAEDRPVAIAVLTFLHREAGMPVAQALRSVRAAMGQGSEALRTLPNRAVQARERRGPPAGVGPPGGASGGPPGAGRGGGPPAGVPAPGQKPGGGKPDNPGQGNSGGNRPGGGPGA